MAPKLITGILAGVVLGSAFGILNGDPGISIAICIEAGTVAAGIWHYLGRG